MIHPHHSHTGRPGLLSALRAYARRSLGKRTLTHEERRNLALGRRRPAVYNASLGCHPHI